MFYVYFNQKDFFYKTGLRLIGDTGVMQVMQAARTQGDHEQAIILNFLE